MSEENKDSIEGSGDAKDDYEQQMEEIRQLQELLDRADQRGSDAMSVESGADADGKSIFVGAVDYSSTEAEVEAFFKACGAITRVTILKDKYTGSPKGFAYVEFEDAAGAQNATLMNGETFKGRALKVSLKRSNLPPHLLRSRGRRDGAGGKGGMMPTGAARRGGRRAGRMMFVPYGYPMMPMPYGFPGAGGFYGAPRRARRRGPSTPQQ